MTQKISILIEDDLDGGPATQTVSFGLDAVDYEIDLNDDNARAFHELLGRYATAARVVHTGSRLARRASPSRTPSERERSRAIRAWAVQAGAPVSARGRIAAATVAAYERALSPQAGRNGHRPGKPDVVLLPAGEPEQAAGQPTQRQASGRRSSRGQSADGERSPGGRVQRSATAVLDKVPADGGQAPRSRRSAAVSSGLSLDKV